MLTNQTHFKLKCGIPIWENSEEYWYLMLKEFVFPKVLAYWKKKTKFQLSPAGTIHPV